MNELNSTAKNTLNELLKGRVVSTVFPVNAADVAASIKAKGSYYLETTTGSCTFVRDDLK